MLRETRFSSPLEAQSISETPLSPCREKKLLTEVCYEENYKFPEL